MNRSRASATCLLAAIAATAWLPAIAQDLATTAGDHAKVVLDNDKVRVIELTMPPGTSTGMHSHKDNVVVFLSGGTATQTMADGTTRQMERKPGTVLWSDPVTHDTKNTGKATSHTLVIELKEPAK
jgi:quercetin dioxygenase-like cupin family protein